MILLDVLPHCWIVLMTDLFILVRDDQSSTLFNSKEKHHQARSDNPRIS